MKVLANLGKLSDGRNVLFLEGRCQPYVIVRNYDPTKREGQQWDNGLYFTSLNQLAKRITAIENAIGYERMSEIASRAIDNLEDEAFEYFNDDVDLNYDEFKYFGLEEEEI